MRLVVARRHDGRLEILHPHARGPVADRHEVLGKERVALEGVHRTVVAVVRSADAVRRVLRLAVAHEYDALLGADHELGRTRDSLVLHRHRAQHGLGVLLLELEILDGLAQAAGVPPEHLAIGGDRCALCARLGLQPRHVVARVAVRLLDGGGVHGGVALAHVPVRHLTVVHAAGEDVGVLGVVVDAAQLRWRLHLEVGYVGVVHVPDVGARAHPLGLRLEAEDGVRDGALAVVDVGVPRDVRRGALDFGGVAEHRERLRERLLRGVVGDCAGEVLLVNVDGVVLLDEILHLSSKVADRLDVVLVLLDFLAVADDVLRLRRVDVLRPTTLCVRETRRRKADLLGVCLML